MQVDKQWETREAKEQGCRSLAHSWRGIYADECVALRTALYHFYLGELRIRKWGFAAAGEKAALKYAFRERKQSRTKSLTDLLDWTK